MFWSHLTYQEMGFIDPSSLKYVFFPLGFEENTFSLFSFYFTGGSFSISFVYFSSFPKPLLQGSVLGSLLIFIYSHLKTSYYSYSKHSYTYISNSDCLPKMQDILISSNPLELSTWISNQNLKLTCPEWTANHIPKWSSHRFPISINDISIFPVALTKNLESSWNLFLKILIEFFLKSYWRFLWDASIIQTLTNITAYLHFSM